MLRPPNVVSREALGKACLKRLLIHIEYKVALRVKVTPIGNYPDNYLNNQHYHFLEEAVGEWPFEPLHDTF